MYCPDQMSSFVISMLFGLAVVWMLTSGANRWAINFLLASLGTIFLLYLWLHPESQLYYTLHGNLAARITDPNLVFGFLTGLTIATILRARGRERGYFSRLLRDFGRRDHDHHDHCR